MATQPPRLSLPSPPFQQALWAGSIRGNSLLFPGSRKENQSLVVAPPNRPVDVRKNQIGVLPYQTRGGETLVPPGRPIRRSPSNAETRAQIQVFITPATKIALPTPSAGTGAYFPAPGVGTTTSPRRLVGLHRALHGVDCEEPNENNWLAPCPEHLGSFFRFSSRSTHFLPTKQCGRRRLSTQLERKATFSLGTALLLWKRPGDWSVSRHPLHFPWPLVRPSAMIW